MKAESQTGRSGLSLPLYRQVEYHLRTQIQSGGLQPGDLLPSVKELCAQFGGINHLTVRQAIKNLAEEQLVRSVQGKGTYVADTRTRRRSIALVLPNLEDFLFLDIARGVQNALDDAGVRTLILDSRGDWDKEAENISHLKDLPLEGAVIFPLTHHDIAEDIFKMKMDSFPFVLVDRYFEDIETHSIVTDNYQGGYDLTTALVQRGRTNFAWVGEMSSSAARQRLQGFRDALNDCGIACPRERIRSISLAPASSHRRYLDSLREGIERELEVLLPLGRPLTLVFGNDQSALLALSQLKARDILVPSEVAVCGFDDRPEAARSKPSLTTVRQPMEALGREAATCLLEQMRGPRSPGRRVCLPVEVVLRESA